MIAALIIAGIFYFSGALFAGKLLKSKLKIWKALLVTFIWFILWTWFLYFSYEGNVPDAALTQVGLGCAMLFLGLRSKMFLPKDQKKTKAVLEGEAKEIYDAAFQHYKEGDFNEAIKKLEQANSIKPNTPIILMGLAHNYAQIGDHNKAIDFIEQAISSGYKDLKKIKSHEDFKKLKEMEEFQRVINKE